MLCGPWWGLGADLGLLGRLYMMMESATGEILIFRLLSLPTDEYVNYIRIQSQVYVSPSVPPPPEGAYGFTSHTYSTGERRDVENVLFTLNEVRVRL